jgi:hypothetical protein
MVSAVLGALLLWLDQDVFSRHDGDALMCFQSGKEAARRVRCPILASTIGATVAPQVSAASSTPLPARLRQSRSGPPRAETAANRCDDVGW